MCGGGSWGKAAFCLSNKHLEEIQKQGFEEIYHIRDCHILFLKLWQNYWAATNAPMGASVSLRTITCACTYNMLGDRLHLRQESISSDLEPIQGAERCWNISENVQGLMCVETQQYLKEKKSYQCRARRVLKKGHALKSLLQRIACRTYDDSTTRRSSNQTVYVIWFR